jgi:hypothetical protein
MKTMGLKARERFEKEFSRKSIAQGTLKDSLRENALGHGKFTGSQRIRCSNALKCKKMIRSITNTSVYPSTYRLSREVKDGKSSLCGKF